MAALQMPTLGERIRAERNRQGLSLRALARNVGVSPSMLSQIETGKTQPSVATLYAITTTLRISVHFVFEASDVDDRVGAPATGSSVRDQVTWSVLRALGASSGHRLGPHVRPAQRQLLQVDSGIVGERLGELPTLPVDFLRVTFAPGSSTFGPGEVMNHPGWEYGFMLRGELMLTLDGQEIALRPGDSVSFESTTPHGYRNDSTEPAVGVWFVLRP